MRNKGSYIIYGVLLVLTAALLIVDATIINSDVSQGELQLTKTVCQRYHNTLDLSDKTLCGQLQTKTGTEYICNNANTHCWLEVK